MDRFYITEIKINKVRHLTDIRIPLSSDKKKHLLLTGKNGSGKTSLLDALAIFLNSAVANTLLSDTRKYQRIDYDTFRVMSEGHAADKELTEIKKSIEDRNRKLVQLSGGLDVKANADWDDIHTSFTNGRFVTAYYKAERIFRADEAKHVEKVKFKNEYAIFEKPGENLLKYLLDLKMTQALAASNGKQEKADQIKVWFDSFESLLKRVFENDTLKLEFDEDTFGFQIQIEGREPFDFNTLSSGYAAVLDVIVDLILRMEKQVGRKFDFTVPGIVLIDEIETHLHPEMQKKVLDLLTTVFPNIQFIVSTHSPFILNSLKDAVIYDLEKGICIENGLTDIPYEGIVEGYFKADTLSAELREKFETYKRLVGKEELTDDDFAQIADLELYLDEIPDYLALNITTEYQRLKQKLRYREDV